MPGSSPSKFTAATTVPNQESWGDYQRHTFSDTFPHVKLQAFSQFVPTSVNTSTINIESRNSNYSGFRWHHLSESTDINQFGSFYFQSFVSDSDGINIFGYDGTNFTIYVPVDVNSNKISNLSPGVAGTDAVNLNQLTASIPAGGVTLTGSVTGSGVLGIPFATTLATTLNNVPVALGSVDLNNNKITNLTTPTVGADAANKTYVDSAISLIPAGTVTLTGNVTGSGSVGSSFATTIALRLNQLPSPIAAVNMSNEKLSNLANATVGTDAVNLNQLNAAVAAGTITLTGDVTGTGFLGTSFATTIAARLNQIPTPTGSVNMNTQDMISVKNLGIGVSSPTLPLQFPNTVADCKICLYQTAANSFQVYGFGVTGSTLKYTVDSSTSSHVFYCAASSSTSTELFRIHGSGYSSVTGGTGTFYSRVPSVHINMPSGSSATTPNLAFVKLNGTTSATTGSVQFTTSNNRITYTGSHLGTSCVGMVTASVNVSFNDLSICNFAIHKNGTQITTTYTWAISPGVNQPFTVIIPTSMVTLSPTDYLEIWAFTSVSTTVITTNRINLSFQAC